MDLYIFVYLLSNVFLAHIINKFMYLFYEKCRVNKYIEFCVYSAYFVLITFIFLFLRSPILNMIFNILYIFALTNLYDYVSFKKGIVVTFIIYLILCVIELTVLAMTSFNRVFNIYFSNEHKNILFMVVNSIFYLIISFLIYIKNINFKKIDLIFSHRISIFFCIVPIISIILIIINFLFSDNILFVIVTNINILFLNIFIFRYCDLILNNLYEKIFEKFLKDKINIYKKEIQNFERKIELKRYINSNNDFINRILNSKISSLDNDIKLKIDILIEENLNISSNDLLIIIGILMDNAISGVKSTFKNKDKYIDVKIKYIKGTIILNIRNSFNESMLNKHKKFIFKNNKFNNYGLGLLSVKEIVEKYKGVLEIKFNKNNFETYILMYDIKV